MEGGIVTGIIVPACLALMMVGLGMTLVPDDFKRVVLYPKATGVGLVFQMILLPLTGFLVASIFPLTPELAVGIMLIAACPGGVASNVITHLAKGDTALAVTLTIISSSLSLVSIPLIVTLSLTHFMGVESAVKLPILETIVKVFILTVPTVVAGMLIKWKAPDFAKRSERAVNIGGLLFLLVLILGVGIKEKDLIIHETINVGPATFSLCLLTTAIGYFGSRLLAVNREQSVSVAIGTGFQNSALALVIATSFIRNLQIAIPPAIYTMTMYLTAGAIIAFVNVRKPAGASVPEPSPDN